MATAKTNWTIENAQKELAKRRKHAGVSVPLSTAIKPEPVQPGRGGDYHHWRALKQQADDMLRDNPIIQKLGTGQHVHPNTYKKSNDILIAWRELTTAVAAYENQHAGELQTWRALARQELQQLKPEPENVARQIKLFGRMMTRAQRLRHELSFRLWAGVRYLANGENNATLATIRAEFSDNGRYAFTSWPNLRKQINQAIDRGYFHYSKDRTRLYFASERRVALEVLGLKSVGGWALHITIEQFTQDFVNNRALFQDAFHGSRGDGFTNPISRQSNKRETGRGKRTQRKYEKLAKVKTAGNYELIEDDTSTERRIRCVKVGDNYELIKDLPNSYSSSLKTVKRGRRWLNRRITYLCNKFSDNGQNPPVLVMGSYDDKIKKKRYFTKPPKVSTDAARFYPLSESSRLWARVT